MPSEIPAWITQCTGLAPKVRWSFMADAPITSASLAREAGELYVTDEIGSIYRIDRSGRILSLTRGLTDVRSICWSDSGHAGAVLVEDRQLCRFNSRMELDWAMDLPDDTLSIAIDPFGRHIAVSMAAAGNLILNGRKKQVAVFESIRPLRHMKFLTTETALIGAAEHGLICCQNLDGTAVWNAKNWSNVGDMSISGDGSSILVAGFNRGVQCYSGDDGSAESSYLLEGTVNLVSTSYTADRIVATTMEHHLYWTDSDGALLWATEIPEEEEVIKVICDPLGEGVICCLASGQILRMDW